MWRVTNLWMTLLWVICITHNTSASDPVLDPATLTDQYGNRADENSDIRWVDPDDPKYMTSTDYEEDQLQLFLNMKDGFINTLQSKMLDKKLIQDLYDNEITYAEAGKQVGVFLIGFAICLVIGILFLIFYPIVGCCFCCCRLCGNCGGKRLQKNSSTAKCICFTVTMDFAISIIFVGGMMMVMMNDRMSFSIDYFGDAVTDNLDDLGLFLNHTADEVDQVAIGGFNFTVDVLERDLQNIDYTLGLPIRDYLGNDLGVYQLLDDMIAMDTTIDNTIEQMEYVDANQTEWDSTMTDLETALSNLGTTLDHVDYLDHTDCQSDTDCLALFDTIYLLRTLADPSLMPNLTSFIENLQGIQDSSDLTATVQTGRQQFDDIPDQLKNDTTAEVADVISDLRSFSSDIDDNLGDITNLTQNSDEVKKLKKSMKNIYETLKNYDGYRSMGFLGSVVLVFLITSLWLIGVIIGPCCYKSATMPTERSCCSNCAGILLMAGAGVAWIFSVLFMLLTVLMFMLGYPMHKFICEPITDPTYAIFDPLIDGPGGILGKNGSYFMGQMVYGNGSIELTLSGVLEDCRENKAAYEALKLENLIDLDQITDWEDSMNVTSILDGMSTDITDIEIMTNDTEAILRDMRDSLSALNYTYMRLLLQQDTTATDLATYAANLHTVADTFSGSLQTNLNNAADTLDGIVTAEYAAAVTAQSDEYDSVVLLEDVSGDVPSDIDQLIADANEVESNLTTNGGDFVRERVSDFTDRETGVINSFADYVTDQFTTEMAKCLPVWNIWKSLIVNGLCDLTIGTLNGVWFAMGWCTFFMFLSTIFSIKLAKYFRKMKYEEGEEEGQGDDDDGDEQMGAQGGQANGQGYNDSFDLPEKKMNGPGPTASNFGPSASKPHGGAVAYPNSPPPAYPGARPKPAPYAANNLNF